MSRHYNITHKNYVPNSSNNINIDLSELDKIINHSADGIYCSCLNYIKIEEIDTIFHKVLNKVKPTGVVIFSIIDVKKYSSDFLHSQLGGQEFLSKLNGVQSILSIEDIYTRIDNNFFKIKQILQEGGTIDVALERIKL
jgi:hypothetical protein